MCLAPQLVCDCNGPSPAMNFGHHQLVIGNGALLEKVAVDASVIVRRGLHNTEESIKCCHNVTLTLSFCKSC